MKAKAIWCLVCQNGVVAFDYGTKEEAVTMNKAVGFPYEVVKYIPAPPAPASRPLSDFGRVHNPKNKGCAIESVGFPALCTCKPRRKSDLREVAKLKPGAKIAKGITKKGKRK